MLRNIIVYMYVVAYGKHDIFLLETRLQILFKSISRVVI